MAVGARLRAAREGRHLTLKAIAESTKISRVTLEAIEDGAWARVPGGIFTRAYVRTFACEVGLDPEDTVRQFLAEVPAANEEVPFRIDDPKERRRSWPAVGTWAVALAVLSIGVAFAWPSAATWLPFGGAPTAAALVSDTESTGVTARAPGAALPTSIDAVDPAAGDAPKPVAAASTATEAPGASAATEAAAASAAPSSAAVPAATEAPAVPTGIRMVIAPRADCWVKVSVDGAQQFARLLRAGERQALEAASRVVIHVGNAGAFDYTLNGEPGRPLGREGQVVTARIDLETMNDFVAR